MNDLVALRLFVQERTWALADTALQTLDHALRNATSVSDLEQLAVRAASNAPSRRRRASDGTVAIIPMVGIVTARPSFFSMLFGGSTIVEMQEQLREYMADRDVSSIVLLSDSPGGTVDLVPEFADELAAAARRKPIVAVASTLAASAAYWIISQATRVLVTPSGYVGSIGVYVQHTDFSGAFEKAGITNTLISAGEGKVDGNEYEPLSKRARTDLQARVDDIYRMFVGAVARGRRVSPHIISTEWKARVVNATDAVALRMADGVATFEQALMRAPSDAVGLQAEHDRDEILATLALLE